jgi:exopolysaccharide biosynthesis WecB/TagA/CpsF family protein
MMEQSRAEAPASPAIAPGVPMSTPPAAEIRQVMGLRYWDADLDRVAHFLVTAALADIRLQVYFVNAHCVNVSARDPEYAQLLRSAPLLFADGAGMALAARLSGVALRHNVNGTDLFPKLCAAAAAASVPIAFLGARRGVARQCATKMEQTYPGLRVVWVEDGYLSSEAEQCKLAELNSSGARLLFVAKGVPAQEHWIEAHRAQVTAPVILGVGALFDFYSGTVPRAPLLWRRLRMEWAYRLLHEPKRLFRRYVLGNPEFVARALWWRVFH